MVYSTATPVVSAVITTVGKDGGTPTTATVNAGDSLTNLVLDNGRKETTIASATVKGFIAKPLTTKHGECTSYDGIPTHNYDAEGDSHFGVIEERMAIDRILIEIPAETEGGKSTLTTIRVSTIKSMTVTAATEDETEDDTSKQPGTEGGGDDPQV